MTRWIRIRVRRRDERGAVAILLAGAVTMLLIVAAMGVDLGNAWQRKITVQKSVDVSALSAGYLLPRTSSSEDAILDEVASWLNRSENVVTGQSGAVTRADLADSDPTNGQVEFIDDEP